MNERPNLPALMVGGAVSAIIPQTIEETWRLATTVVEAGMAPVALTGREPGEDASGEVWQRWGKKATSAVTTVILSGAELGLPPMVSLRSFTVIGGKPALYGDGLVNVVRRSRKQEFIRSGFVKNATDEFLIKIGVDPEKLAEMKTSDDRTLGYCWAKRADTREEKTEIFSIAQAKKANLWDERQTRRGKVWKDGKQVWDDVPNDTTWFRYPERMLKWRSEGYCLRDLFAEVLGGVRDEFEAREIAGELFEHHEEPVGRISPPSPPKVPSPPSPDASEQARPPSPPSANGASAGIDRFPKDLEDVSEEKEPFDYGDYFERLQVKLRGAKDAADVEDIWSAFDPEATFQDDPESRELADKIKARKLATIVAGV